MRLLFLNHNVARRGGTFYRAYHVARYLVRRGHAVTLLTISAGRRWGFEREESEGVEIIHTPDLLWGVGRTGWDPWDMFNRIAYLRGRAWDIIHAWDCRPVVIVPALFARRQSERVGGKLVVDWCDWWGRGGTQAERPGTFAKRIYGPVETYFEEAFRTRADGTTVASRALRDRAWRLGVPVEPTLVLPGGSDTETIRPLDLGAARARLGLPADAYLVGYMGALPASEVDVLLETLLLARAQIPNLRFLAVGVSIAGSPLSFRAAAGQRWGDWISEIGRVPFAEVGKYLATCNVLFLPMRKTISNIARWPSKINDYLASGRPIVATSVGEIATLAQESIGVLADAEPQALADGLIRIARDPALAEQFGCRGRALAEGKLNWSSIVDRLDAFYSRVRANR